MASQQAAMEAAVSEVAAMQLLEVAKKEEERLDEAIQKLDNMGEDDFEILRQKRLEKMKQQQRQKTEWKFLGHGSYTELANQQEFFDMAKKSPRVICHFYRPTTRHCEVVDAHMERLAPKHMETRFVKINAEKSPYLVEKLNIFMMPTLLLIKDGQTVHHVRGFDEFGGTDRFSSDIFAFVLSSYKVLNYDGPPPEALEAEQGVNSIKMSLGARSGKSSIKEGLHERNFGDDEDEY